MDPRRRASRGEDCPNELRLLGRTLQDRSGDVIAGMEARNRAASVALATDVEQRFARISLVSTIAVARWMAGEPEGVAREVGREAWTIFGQLAMDHTVPLNEVTKRCLRWADAACDVLREAAAEADVSVAAVEQAEAMVRRSLEVTLVRMCESFEAVRQRSEEQLQVHERELAFLASHDEVTGLPNRTLLIDRIEQLMARSRRFKTPIAALVIDVDNFKSINDTLGHEAGNELLVAIAARLEGVTRDVDALGCLGGDEFVVVAEGQSLAAGPEQIAERLRDALEAPFELGPARTEVRVTTSIGIALGSQQAPAELLRDADIAMNQAKATGRHRYVVFETAMQNSVQSRMELEMDLRTALQNDEFMLLYQPTVDLADMSPTGVEALLRWQHPVRGLVQPNDFVPLLEETGMIVAIGRWVLQQACAQAVVWRRSGYPISMAVNVSARQLEGSELAVDIRNILAETGLEPQALTIEITETALMRNAQETARLLSAIKSLGVRIAIDDFGTGYSSLAHLRQFPVDALKIDRSFIAGMTNNRQGETLIHTLVQLGKALSIETLAEGIEEPQELSLLRAERCDSGQGYLFARPLTTEAAEAFLQEWSAKGAALGQGRIATA